MASQEAQEAQEVESYDDLVYPQLDVRHTREVFLITYSQAPPQMTKEEFADMVVNSLVESGSNCVVEKWVCSKEPHRRGGIHFHLTVKLNKQRRWLSAKNLMQERHGITLHFANRRKEDGESSLYDGAYQYTVKGGDFIRSPGHPDPENEAEDEEKEVRMSNFDFMKLCVQKELRTVLQVQATAKHNSDGNEDSLAKFLSNKSKGRVAEILEMAWGIEEAPAKLARLELDRISILKDCEKLPCTCETPSLWQKLANEILELNGIAIDAYTQSVLAALTLGRGKFRNILHMGGTNRGKTFLIQPLKLIYTAFNNPSRGTFNWIGVNTAEIILLNDFRWASDVLPWEQMLLLLEGDIVRFPMPKNQYGAVLILN